jgi:hypothetical protein
MAYYVTVIDGPRSDFLAGPFNTHGAALAMVEPAREVCQNLIRESIWFGFGTAHVRTGRSRVGKLNDRLTMPDDRLP